MTTATTTRISGVINGREHTLEIDNAMLLLDLLRACTVQLDGLPISACTTLAIELDGRTVETVEGLGVSESSLHPVQQSFIERSAFQCGFCTPGMVMTAKALLEENPAPSRDDVVHWLEGSICRCTGYEPIVDAVLDAAEAMARG
jgi:aerobic carbon-monoxide dehydrogenase small subunit